MDKAGSVSKGRRCLILACSQRKITGTTAVVASALYDGSAWRVLRTYRAAHPDDTGVTVLALSGRHGLIHADTRQVDWYDARLTAGEVSRAMWRHTFVLRPWQHLLRTYGPFDAGFVCAGAMYRQALVEVEWPAPIAVSHSAGGIGTQLGQLKRWLWAS